ncbi:hypothetical protein FSP39_008941 [Pinctada imbricata]|uniref:Acyl-CoA thioesterase 2 C-terminal domain-containing protein n=1 Tax=Pinctada imbricata TaxID=66713 RepID=A0AA88XK53_PINIB|nr:hypothetical protein FSP39_008941 [Pinctada imbricata]
MQASFKCEEEDPLQHQFTMPQVPGPEGLESSNDFLQRQLDENPDTMSEKERKMIINMLKQKFHVDKRPVDPELYHLRKQGEPKRYVWVRAQGNIGENLKLQQCVAGFISDIALLGAAMQPAPTGHKVGFITSLDHSMWFHNPFRADEWMLYEIESPQCGKGKALSIGRMWRQDGVLAVSMAQEGVVRSHKSML